MQTFYKICLLLLIVGGVNWGLVGLFQFDLVGWLLGGSTSVWSRIVFALVGLAALGCIPELFSEERLLHAKCSSRLCVAALPVKKQAGKIRRFPDLKI